MEIINFIIETLTFQNRPLNGAHFLLWSIFIAKDHHYPKILLYSSRISLARDH